MAQVSGGMSETERLAHYRELAVQFREWAQSETNEEARAGLLDMARPYARLATELAARNQNLAPQQ
jgi:hypothetical protein